MIVFGGGCLNVWNEVRGSRRQPNHQGHRHHRSGRDTKRRWQMPRAGLVVGSYAFCSAPHSKVVPSVQMQWECKILHQSPINWLSG
jgi:hypothetical protein